MYNTDYYSKIIYFLLRMDNNNELSNFERNMMSLRGAIHNLVSDTIQDSWDMWEQYDLPGRTQDIIENAKARMGMVFPQVDIKDMGNDIVVHADIPGVDPETLEIEIAEDHIYLAGIANYSEETEEEENYYSYERHFGSFERMIPLPDYVDVDASVGSVDNGILTITLPKLMIDEPAPAKKVTKSKKAPAKKKAASTTKAKPKAKKASAKKAATKKPAAKKAPAKKKK